MLFTGTKENFLVGDIEQWGLFIPSSRRVLCERVEGNVKTKGCLNSESKLVVMLFIQLSEFESEERSRLFL